MIRVFNLYVPSSKLFLVIGDALLLATGFFLLFRPLTPADTMEDVQLYLLVLLASIVGIWSFYFSDLYEHATMRSRQSVLVAGLRGLGISACYSARWCGCWPAIIACATTLWNRRWRWD